MNTPKTLSNPRHQLIQIAYFIVATITLNLSPSFLAAQICDPYQSAKLLPHDGDSFDEYGVSVSIDGNTAVIGSHLGSGNGGRSGSVYVFVFQNETWNLQAKLLPADGEEGDRFGRSTSIDGNTIIIGAFTDTDNGPSSGSAYIFTRKGNVWTEQAKLLPTDGDAEDLFGYSVSISGTTALVGAFGDDNVSTYSGAAYIFTSKNSQWTQQAKLTSTTEIGNRFGSSVSLSGDTAVIGAHLNNDFGPDSGSAYIFRRVEKTWTLQSKLLPTSGNDFDYFGIAVSVEGDTAVIGASGNATGGPNSGAAYVFTRTENQWTQHTKLTPPEGSDGGRFGVSVDINENTIAIGANRDSENGSRSGAAYAFKYDQNKWSRLPKFFPSDGRFNLEFANSISISGDKVLLGSHFDDDNGRESGSAYLFDLNCLLCPADLTNDGLLNFFDISEFLQAFAIQSPIADFDNDGLFNFFDISEFLQAFAAGCP